MLLPHFCTPSKEISKMSQNRQQTQQVRECINNNCRNDELQVSLLVSFYSNYLDQKTKAFQEESF